MAELRAGAAKVDITPVTSCWMAGYGSRYENGPKSTGVHDPLHARVALAEGEGGRAALVSCDLCFVHPQTVEQVRGLVCGPLEMPPEHVMVVATHTHAGPTTRPDAADGKTDREWLECLAHKMAEAAFRAALRLRPAKAGVVRGESKIAMNRQQTFDDGTVGLGAAPEKPTDTELTALVVDSADGKPIARIVNYNCHNTTLGPGNTLLSGDYAGQAMSAVEAQLGGDVVCAFVNGGAGNADPFHRVLADADDPRATEVAEAFTRDVLRTLERTGRLGDDARIAGAFHDMALPRKAASVEAGLGRCKHVRAQAIRIGPAIVIGSPEEVVCEVAMNVKRQSPAAETLFASYCPNAVGDPSRMHDSAGGYLPAAAHYEFGGYEVRVSPYSPEAEAVYTREMLALAAKIEKMP